MLEESNFKLNGWYTFLELKKLGLSIGGQVPTNKSWVHIDNNVVTDYSLKFDDYVVNYDEQNNKNIISKGYLKKYSEYIINNIDYYIDTLIVKNNPVYYNPVIGKKCTKEEYEKSYNSSTDMYDNSKVGFKGNDTNGCMKWYKYSVNLDGTVNMILDHNTSVGVKWANVNNNNQKAENALKVMNGLLEDGTIGDTSLWSDQLIREDKYKAIWKQNMDEDYITTEIDYTGYKARLITAQEVADITSASEPSPIGIGFSEHDNSYEDWFYLDGKNYMGIETVLSKKWQKQVASGQNNSSYSWLFDNLYGCVSYGCSVQQNSNGNYAYWTSTPATGSFNRAWQVSSAMGSLDYYDTNYAIYGVRPVITIHES